MQSKLKLICMFFLLFSISIHAQVTIRGTVVSAEDQQPLPGVSVLVKGTTNGTVTDIDGNYTIETATGNVLVFTFVGFVPDRKSTRLNSSHVRISYAVFC